MYYLLLAILLAITPLTSEAAATTGSLQGLITGIGKFMSEVIIPVILGIAFLAVVWNTVRFFIIGANNEESQQNAKTLAFYSVAAFVFILGFWGIVNILTNGIGLPNEKVAPCDADKMSDYVLLNNGTALEPCTPAVVGGGLDTDSIDTTPLPDVGATEVATRDAAKAAIQAAAGISNTNDFEILYGVNKNVVASALFPDLVTARNSASDLDRLRGAYRLSSAGTINTTLLDNYLAATEAYNTKIGHPELNAPLTMNNISNIVVPLPSAVKTAMTVTKNGFANALDSYNRNVGDMSPIIPVTAADTLFNTALTPAERVANFNSFMRSDYNVIVTSSLRDAFMQNINTENAFAGIFSNPQI